MELGFTTGVLVGLWLLSVGVGTGMVVACRRDEEEDEEGNGSMGVLMLLVVPYTHGRFHRCCHGFYCCEEYFRSRSDNKLDITD